MKLQKKYLILLIVTVLFIVFLISIFLLRDSQSGYFKKYLMDISIEAVDNTLNVENYHIVIKDDGKVSKSEASHLGVPIYTNENETFYLKNGRYKKVESEYSYRNINKILKKVDNKSSETVISANILNNLLKSLYIDFEVNKDVTANLTYENNLLKYFNLYLRDIFQYKSILISISLQEISDSNYMVDTPIFYKELTDIDDGYDLKILNK